MGSYLKDQGQLVENLTRQAQENGLTWEYTMTINYSEHTCSAVVIFGHSTTPAEARESKNTSGQDCTMCGMNHSSVQGFAPFYIVCGAQYAHA